MIQRALLTTPLLTGYRRFGAFFWPNQTVVGGVSVNSLCQYSGLVALSVNKHSIYGHSEIIRETQNRCDSSNPGNKHDPYNTFRY